MQLPVWALRAITQLFGEWEKRDHKPVGRDRRVPERHIIQLSIRDFLYVSDIIALEFH